MLNTEQTKIDADKMWMKSPKIVTLKRLERSKMYLIQGSGIGYRSRIKTLQVKQTDNWTKNNFK